MNDLRYSARTLRRMGGVILIAVTTLALGIGATTTMYGAASAALLRPLPFADPDGLVLLFTTRTTPRDGLMRFRWSRPLLDTLSQSVTSYEAIASFTPTLISISGGRGEPEQIDGEIVSPEYFAMLRIAPVYGRTFM